MCNPAKYFTLILFLLYTFMEYGDSKLTINDKFLWKKQVEAEKEYWFDQILDHFDHSNNKTFKQRYFYSDAFYRRGGPIFIHIGGEGPISAPWLYNGLWVNIANDVGAVMYILEHRYYGKTHPANNTSANNLKYLSSQQALSDLANFISTIKKSFDYDVKCIVYGGSYAGSLALWSKLKYPHLIHGTVAASAPLVAIADFDKYLEVVLNAIKTYGGTECLNNIENAVENIISLLKTSKGRAELKFIFDLCAYLNPNGEDDGNFMELIISVIQEIVQYSKDNRVFEGAKLVNILTLCDIMNNETIGRPIQRYVKANQLIYNVTDCIDANYQDSVFNIRNTSWEASLASTRLWTYQTCTEFGWFQTTDSPSISWTGISVLFHYKFCSDVFGPEFTKELLQAGIKQTNQDYGGREIVKHLNRAVLFNGGVDPWHAVSYIQDDKLYKHDRTINKIIYQFNKFESTINDKEDSGGERLRDSIPLPVVPDTLEAKLVFNDPTAFTSLFVPSSAHCALLYPPSKDDDPLLVESRRIVHDLVNVWIDNSIPKFDLF